MILFRISVIKRQKNIFRRQENVFMKGFRVLSLDYMIGKYGIIIIWQKINGVKIKRLSFWCEKKYQIFWLVSKK